MRTHAVLDVPAVAGLARRLHAECRDRHGRDFFTACVDPVATALAPHGVDAVMAGYLHASLTSAGATAQSLTAAGVPANVVVVVVALTPPPGQPTNGVLAVDPVARLVQLAVNTLAVTVASARMWRDPALRTLLEGDLLPARRRLLTGMAISGAQIVAMEQTLAAADARNWADYRLRAHRGTVRRRVGRCWGACGMVEAALVVTEISPWYGSVVRCTGCGDGWADGEMLPRPFRRGWRAAAVADAQRLWDLSCSCPIVRDEDLYPVRCEHDTIWRLEQAA